MVMTTVGILFDKKPDSKMDPSTQKKVQNWWPPIQKLMNQMDFLDQVQNYPKDDLTEEKIKALAPITSQEKYDAEKIKSSSTVAASFASWVKAMEEYYKVNLIVKPKKAQLVIAEEESAKAGAIAKAARTKLDSVRKELNALQANLN